MVYKVAVCDSHADTVKLLVSRPLLQESDIDSTSEFDCMAVNVADAELLRCSVLLEEADFCVE